MAQLKLGHIFAFVKQLQEQGMTMAEITALPIYIGDDDELNGIHCAWYTNLVDSNDTEDEDNVYTVEMINDTPHNIELNGKAILIS